MFVIWVLSFLSAVLCERRSWAIKTSKWPYSPDLHAAGQLNTVGEEIQQKLLDPRVVLTEFNSEEDTESTDTTSVSVRTPKLKVTKRKSANNKKQNQQNKSYFSDNFVRFLNVAVSKNHEEVMKILKPGRNIAVSMQKKTQLLLAEGPIGTNFYRFLQKLCYESYDYIKKYLTSLLNYMQNRLVLCSVEFNELIDFIETLYEEEDGEVLNKVIGEFERFPKGLNRFTTTQKYLNLESRMDMLLKSYQDLIKKDQNVKHEQNRGLKSVIRSSTTGSSFSFSSVSMSSSNAKTYSFKTTSKKNVYRDIKTLSTSKIQMANNTGSLDVLQSQSTNQEMEEEVEGNFCLAYIKFTGELMAKKPSHLRAIMKHANKVIKGLQKDGKLKFLGKIEDLVCEVFIQFFYYKRPERINIDAEKYHRKMVHRKSEYDEEINEIFDFANDFVTSTQAEHIYEVVDEIHAYPRVNKTAETLCREVFKAFVVPFSNASNSIYFKNFLPEVVNVLRREYPDIFARVDPQHEEYN